MSSAPSRALALCLLLGLPVRAAQEPPAGDAGRSGELGDLQLEELLNLRIERVFTASKYDQQVTRAPASVTIVTAEEIRQFGYRTLADMLRAVRGIYVTYDRNYSNLGVRGFARPGDFNTRMLLLVDGHRMNDSLYAAALIGPEAILDLDLIERVEIIRGPSSSIYGNSAFFGVINVITRSGEQIDGVEASVSAGSGSTYREGATFGKRLDNGLEWVGSVSRLDSAGAGRLFFREFDDPAHNDGVAEDADGEISDNLFGRLSYRDFTLSAAYSRRVKEVPTAAFGAAFDTGKQETTDGRKYLDLKYQHAVSADTGVMARAAYDRYEYFADFPSDYAAPGDPRRIVVSHDDNHGDGALAEVQVTQKLSGRNLAVFGAEYRKDLKLEQSNFSDHPRSFNFRSDREGSAVGLYAQSEIELGPQLLLNAGLRYDHYDNFGGTLNPRFGLIYNPRSATTIKALYGSAFRAPNAYERYLEAAHFNKANPDLKPETIRTFELVLERYLAHGVLFTASAYHYRIRGLITQMRDPADGLLVFRNIDAVDAVGVEVGVERRLAGGLLARATYAWQRAEDRRTKHEFTNSPRHLAKLNLAFPFPRSPWSSGIELQYLSHLHTLGGGASPGFLLANLTFLSRRLTKDLDLSASIYNLFDRSYSYPGSTGHLQELIPQDGRSLRIKLSCGF